MELRLAQRGILTLPKTLRKRYGYKVGDSFTLVDLGDGVFVLRPGRSRVDDAADALARALHQRGESLESMLTSLRARREKGD